ncbi:hypothetical protein BN439_3889 [Erwinia amylovora Ea644]|nr:hypothetical protein BN439_3889 [Erwinia amylovora Ea644]CCP08992.1 hypothetical protein BN440_4008 [Erwinia amylovora MR1]
MIYAPLVCICSGSLLAARAGLLNGGKSPLTKR